MTLRIIKERGREVVKVNAGSGLYRYTWETGRMVHKDEITRIRVGSKLHRGGYIGMHTSDCICVFPSGIARETDGG